MEVAYSSTVHFSEHDVHTAENHHRVRDGLPQAHVFENREVDEAGRAHAVTVWIRSTVADEVESEFAFGRLDAAIGFARLGPKAAQPGFRIEDRSLGNFFQRLLENLQALAHFEDANHVTVVDVTVLAQRHPEAESPVDAIAVHLSDVVIDPAGPEPRPGDAGVD